MTRCRNRKLSKQTYPSVTIFLLCRGCTVQGYCIKRHVWRVEEGNITEELIAAIRHYLAGKRASGLTPAKLRRLLKATYNEAKIRILDRRTKLEADLPIEALYVSENQMVAPSLMWDEPDVEEANPIDFFKNIMTVPDGDVHVTSKKRWVCIATLLPIIWPSEVNQWRYKPANDNLAPC